MRLRRINSSVGRREVNDSIVLEAVLYNHTQRTGDVFTVTRNVVRLSLSVPDLATVQLVLVA